VARSRSRGGSGKFVLGFVLGLVLAAGGAAAYFKFGKPPVRVAGPPVPIEKIVASPPANAEIEHEVKKAPFGTNEDVFEAGAHVYKNQCAFCHGTPGRDVAFAKYMNPVAPQLWKKHAHGNVVGVSDDEAGETYWKVANGIHQTGMPSYQHVLSDTQMWQVSLLLKNADQQLPDPVMAILTAAK
jgi:thiosulfate dehydrogenase